MSLYQALLAVQYSVIVFFLFMSAVVIKSWSKPAHGYLYFYCSCALMNAAGYLAVMLAKTMGESVLAWKLCYLGRPWIPFAMFVFTLFFTKTKCPVWILNILASFHAFIYILVLTMDKNALYYKSFYFTEEGIFPHLVRAPGIMHYVFDALVIFYIVVGSYLLFHSLRREKEKKKKRQLNFVLSAFFMNSLFFVLQISRLVPGYDVNNLGFALSAFFFYIAVIHCDIMDTKELARDFVVEKFSEGVLATNESGALSFVNDKAQKIFAELSLSNEQGLERVKELLAKDKPLFCSGRIYALKADLLRKDRRSAGMAYVIEDTTERWRYTEALKVEKKKSESLLLNILPKEIADELSRNPGMTIARDYPNATVLFTDIVGFTKMSGGMTAHDVVEMLNKITSLFDERATREKIEKIKTIGDSYMAAAGLVESAENDGAQKIVRFAQGLLQDIERYNESSPVKIQIRIGVNSGNLVAGVIGKTKFIYDIWGDTVNVASRMESSGQPMKIHVSQSVWERTKDSFEYGELVETEVKGKGLMKTYYLR